MMLAWLLLLSLVTSPEAVSEKKPEAIVQEANDAALKGEKATTYEERKLALNRALYLYSLAEQEVEAPSSSLDRAIGDLYDQLEEYPWSILYYHRALNADPHDTLAADHLEKVRQKMGIPAAAQHPFYQNPFIHILESLTHQYYLMFWIIILVFLCYSLSLWLPLFWIKKITACISVLLALLLANSLFFYYSTPIEGIVIASSGFYRAPDKNEPQLTAHPLLAGTKVTVLQMTSKGEWVKITNSDGLVGYIPSMSLKLI